MRPVYSASLSIEANKGEANKGSDWLVAVRGAPTLLVPVVIVACAFLAGCTTTTSPAAACLSRSAAQSSSGGKIGHYAAPCP